MDIFLDKNSGNKIQIGLIYGHFEVVKKLDKKEYGCRCIACGEKWRWTAKKLYKLPQHKKCKIQKKSLVKKEDSKTTVINPKTSESIFLQDKKSVQSLINEVESQNQGNSSIAFSVTNLRMLLDLIPYGESAYRKWPTQANANAITLLV